MYYYRYLGEMSSIAELSLGWRADSSILRGRSLKDFTCAGVGCAGHHWRRVGDIRMPAGIRWRASASQLVPK